MLGWEAICWAADQLIGDFDLTKECRIMFADITGHETDITAEVKRNDWLASKAFYRNEFREASSLRCDGYSKNLGTAITIVFYNQTRIVSMCVPEEDIVRLEGQYAARFSAEVNNEIRMNNSLDNITQLTQYSMLSLVLSAYVDSFMGNAFKTYDLSYDVRKIIRFFSEKPTTKQILMDKSLYNEEVYFVAKRYNRDDGPSWSFVSYYNTKHGKDSGCFYQVCTNWEQCNSFINKKAEPPRCVRKLTLRNVLDMTRDYPVRLLLPKALKEIFDDTYLEIAPLKEVSPFIRDIFTEYPDAFDLWHMAHIAKGLYETPVFYPEMRSNKDGKWRAAVRTNRPDGTLDMYFSKEQCQNMADHQKSPGGIRVAETTLGAFLDRNYIYDNTMLSLVPPENSGYSRYETLLAPSIKDRIDAENKPEADPKRETDTTITDKQDLPDDMVVKVVRKEDPANVKTSVENSTGTDSRMDSPVRYRADGTMEEKRADDERLFQYVVSEKNCIDGEDADNLLRTLPVQGLIMLYDNSGPDSVPEEDARVLSDFRKRLRLAIPVRLMSSDRLYFAFDHLTEMPFMEGDTINVFTVKKYADMYVDYQLQQLRTGLYIKEIPQNGLIKFFSELRSLYGAENAMIDNGMFHTAIALDEIVSDDTFYASYKGLTSDSTRNPGLVRALIDMVTEQNWRLGYPEKESTMRHLRNMVYEEMRRARFLVPVTIDESRVAPDGTYGGPFRYDTVQLNGGKTTVAMFTDPAAAGMYEDMRIRRLLPSSLQDILSNSDADIYTLCFGVKDPVTFKKSDLYAMVSCGSGNK